MPSVHLLESIIKELVTRYQQKEGDSFGKHVYAVDTFQMVYKTSTGIGRLSYEDGMDRTCMFWNLKEWEQNSPFKILQVG